MILVRNWVKAHDYYYSLAHGPSKVDEPRPDVLASAPAWACGAGPASDDQDVSEISLVAPYYAATKHCANHTAGKEQVCQDIEIDFSIPCRAYPDARQTQFPVTARTARNMHGACTTTLHAQTCTGQASSSASRTRQVSFLTHARAPIITAPPRQI